MKRSEAQAKYKWDFSHLYKSDQEWKNDLANLVSLAENFQAMKGKLNQKEVFYKYLDLDNKIDKIVNKLAIYLHYGDTDTSDQRYQILEGLLMNEFRKINVATAFVSPEIKSVGEQTITTWLTEKSEYKVYLKGMKKFFEEAKHILSEHDEELLSKVARSLGAIGGMYDTLAYADRHDENIHYKGKDQVLTTSLMMEISEDSDPINDQELRIQAAKIYRKNFSDKKHSFASIYEGILQNSTDSIRIRNYATAIEASLNGDNIPLSIYLKLLEIGKKFIDPFKEYNLLIKDTFKMDKFYATDRQLKLVHKYNKKFTVEEAQILIKDALQILGKEYLDNLEIAWGDNKIDYYEDTNKRDGAYSTGGAGVDPIILMNWDDKLNSVNTLAHESGHSVHTLFADQNQPYPLSQYPIILAEVASTINEHLLFEYLYNKANDKQEKIYLLQQRISDLMSTFYRQIQFADFEYRAHQLVEKDEPLTADILANLFNETQIDYGYEIFDKNEDDKDAIYGWPRISHFFHSPFYVYKYAIDVTASFKLYNDIKNGNVQSTLNFLKAGGHKDPLDVMLDAGIDFTKEETYMPLINGIKEYLKELKTLLQK
ncbi:oligoendopeptidase F [Williamsoniiplasma somnilux]|uniref:Oligopeptidase F n=1 Tax=Williamsoniiplasma somnilux TaxID=215578 RepID=A0A2K8NXN4_9MOLU|nr:oligoendopeptidase F [Williamsoniiplasma somnilux]ATZ18504.1 oligoendopeptidase F [Williamsoniiplasma somnilux]